MNIFFGIKSCQKCFKLQQKDINGKTFLFLRNIQLFIYQKTELNLSHFYIEHNENLG